MTRWWLAAPLALAACTAAPTLVSAPSPQEHACADRVDEDPAVKEAIAISAGQPNWEFQNLPYMEQLKRDAITRCLRARGLAPRGGVERPR